MTRVDGGRGHDVQYRGLFDAVRVVETHPVYDPRTAIVADDPERREAERVHHRYLLDGQFTF